MTTLLLGIGDLHSKRSNQDELKACAHKISAQIMEQKPNAIVILGDLGNDHERAYLVALNGMVTFLELVNYAAISVGAKIYYIIGNHDRCNHRNPYCSDILSRDCLFGIYQRGRLVREWSYKHG